MRKRLVSTPTAHPQHIQRRLIHGTTQGSMYASLAPSLTYGQCCVALTGKSAGPPWRILRNAGFPPNELLSATLLPIADRSVLVVASTGCQFAVACFDMWVGGDVRRKVAMSGMLSPGDQVRLFRWAVQAPGKSGPIKSFFDSRTTTGNLIRGALPCPVKRLMACPLKGGNRNTIAVVC